MSGSPGMKRSRFPRLALWAALNGVLARRGVSARLVMRTGLLLGIAAPMSAGAVLLAALVACSGVLDADGLRQSAHKIAAAKLALPPLDAFVRGALCNMLVCLAVWFNFAATTAPGKMLAVVLPIAAFVAVTSPVVVARSG